MNRVAGSTLKLLAIALGASGLACDAAAIIDGGKNGRYDEGSWQYVYSIRAAGSRSEWRHGELSFEGWAIEKLIPKVQRYDKVRTPWGVMQYLGPKHPYNSGWLSTMTYGHALYKRGRMLPTPKPGAALAAKKRPMDVTPKHSDEAVEAFVGQTLRIRLRGNPSTGFTWVVKRLKGESVAQQGKLVFEKGEAAAGMVGAGGTVVVPFKALKPGPTTVLLEYKRPWEQKDPARAQVLRFVIKADEVDRPEPEGK